MKNKKGKEYRKRKRVSKIARFMETPISRAWEIDNRIELICKVLAPLSDIKKIGVLKAVKILLDADIAERNQ